MLVQEIKERIKVVMVSIMVLVIILVKEREKVIYILRDLLGGRLVEVSILDTFKVIIELVCILSLILSIPLIMLQIYLFICQGLYKKEQQRLKKVLVINILLWILGLVTFKILFINIRDMLFSFKNVGISEIESVESVLSNYKLIIKILISLLLIYQVPIIIQISIYIKLVNGLQLLKNRRYYILGIILLIMLVNGVEIWSNIILVLSFVGIYEILGIKARVKEIKR